MKETHYIEDYTAQEAAEIEELTRKAYARLPFTMAHLLRRYELFIGTKEYLQAMISALDFFEISSQYLSTVLFAFLHSKQVGDEEIEKIVRMMDVKRPLSFGDWVNSIFQPVTKSALRLLPDNAVVKSINEQLFPRKQNLITGDASTPSIVAIRNRYKGHGTLLTNEQYKEVIGWLERRIWSFVKAAMPLCDYMIFAPIEDGSPVDDGIPCASFNGLGINRVTIKSTLSLTKGNYYLYEGNDVTAVNNEARLINLSPLVVYHEQYVYVFQTLKEEEICYVSSHEQAKSLSTQIYNNAFDSYMQLFVPSFDISKERNFEELRDLMQDESVRYLKRLKAQRKYNRELFVDRKALSAHLAEFMASSSVLFPILGEAGQGKTNQLCFWCEQFMEKKRGVVIFNCDQFSDFTLDEKLRDVFKYISRKPIKKLLDQIHKTLVGEDETLYFIFDAVNECLSYKDSADRSNGSLDLYNDIRRLLVSDDYPRFKTILTCRSFTWKKQLHREDDDSSPLLFHPAGGGSLAVNGFTDEELQEAYITYRRVFQTQTEADVLFGSSYRKAFIRLKDPLILRIACTCYMQKELPPDSSCYTSIELFAQSVAELKHSYAGNQQYSIILHFAQSLLDSYHHGTPRDNLSLKEIRDVEPQNGSPLGQMHKFIFQSGGDLSIAYNELLNRSDKPFLRLLDPTAVSQQNEERIQFLYERFLEYMMALVFIGRVRNSTGAPIPAQSYIDELQQTGSGAVIMGALRNALLMDYSQTGQADTIIELALLSHRNYEVMLIVTDTLNVMVREHYGQRLIKMLHNILSYKERECVPLFTRIKQVTKKIEDEGGDAAAVEEQKRLLKQLEPVRKLRKIASISLNGMFRSDFFNEDLYTAAESPYPLLWKSMNDTLDDVRNDAGLYIYYLSLQKSTSGCTSLRMNLADKIIAEIFKKIKHISLVQAALSKKQRGELMHYLESGCRIALVLIIDALVVPPTPDYRRVNALMKEVESVFRSLSANFLLIRIVMPLFKVILRRQGTVQSMYVNNMVEYQRFWDNDCVAENGEREKWNRSLYNVIPRFLKDFYRQNVAHEQLDDKENFASYYPAVMDAYRTGDSFSYFLLERVMIIEGLCSWQLIRPIVVRFFDEYRDNPHFDYSQMSILYSLFHIISKSEHDEPEMMQIFERECNDWTRRCKGFFEAHRNFYANHGNPYKQYVMNWYCVAYCRGRGDGEPREGDNPPVPLFYDLIGDAVRTGDKDLLYHCLDNISVTVSDFGLYRTALGLLKYVFEQFTDVESVQRFDALRSKREEHQDDLTAYLGKVLGTIKNYYPQQVDMFVRKELVNLSYPNIDKYREEILNFNPTGETIGDLITHRFGNFLVWGVMYEKNVGNFAEDVFNAAASAHSYFDWFDAVVKIAFRHLYGIKL